MFETGVQRAANVAVFGPQPSQPIPLARTERVLPGRTNQTTVVSAVTLSYDLLLTGRRQLLVSVLQQRVQHSVPAASVLVVDRDDGLVHQRGQEIQDRVAA